MKRMLFILGMLVTIPAFCQDIGDLINKVNLDSLTLTLNEFSGEISTQVNGNTVTILNRVSSTDNNLAADYLVQKLNQYDNLIVTDQVYDPGNNGGRNIFATQTGKTNPDDIYILCAHYDAVADYCADDNVSGTAAVLEMARILSTQCTDSTIVYALWDEEESGLTGSNFYAQQAATNGDNILAVLNMDMMAYDGDGDNDFDIDVRDFANSLAMKDDIIAVLNTYGFNLNVNVVNPGTTASDHSRFWNQGYTALLLGEAWSNNDQTPHYHSSNDRVSTLDLSYYHELTKLVMGYMATKVGLVNVTNTVTETTSELTADQVGAMYQWINCDTDMPIAGETNQSFTPTVNGNYAVEITSGSCSEKSDCILFSSLSVDDLNSKGFEVYPNPVSNRLTINLAEAIETRFQIFDIYGRHVTSTTLITQNNNITVEELSSGIYFVNLKNERGNFTFTLIKD